MSLNKSKLYNKIKNNKTKQNIDSFVLSENIDTFIQAGNIHKQIRNYLNTNNIVKPGIKLLDLANIIESKTLEFGSQTAFPTGLSVNHIIAHNTPEINSKESLLNDDLIKIDFGIHIDGCIIDSAYTYSSNPGFKPLIDATREATYNAIKLIGIDSRLNEIGKIIEETISSYEITINNKTIPIKPIYNLAGHNIEHYNVHGNIVVPLFYEEKNNDKIKEDTILAIETFASTGSGFAQKSEYSSHFQRTGKKAPLNFQKSKDLLKSINTYKNLPFSTRQLNILPDHYGLKELIQKNIIEPHPILLDIPGSYTSQTEHTIIVTEKRKYNLSIGDDY
jgi:methionyl aminopeptidase